MDSTQASKDRIWVTPKTKDRLNAYKKLVETDARGLRAESFETVINRKLDELESIAEMGGMKAVYSGLLGDIYGICEDADKDFGSTIRTRIEDFDKLYNPEMVSET